MATVAMRDAGLAIDPLDVSRAELYRDDVWQAPFGELRATAPVHYVAESGFGPIGRSRPANRSSRSNRCR